MIAVQKKKSVQVGSWPDFLEAIREQFFQFIIGQIRHPLAGLDKLVRHRLLLRKQ